MVKCQRRQNGQLINGVNTLDIISGVSFCVAAFLGFRQRLPKSGVVISHPGEDVVGSAVDDAANRAELISQQFIHQTAQNGNAAADAGLEQQINPLPPG